MTVRTAGARGRANGKRGEARVFAWPEDPAQVSVTDIDFEALAHVLANCCRRGGHMRHYHSLAAHAVIVSEEIEALDGLEGEDRRTLALHALIAGTASAWFRGVAPLDGEGAGSARAADRIARLATGIEAAVREAAGLDPVLDEERAELLRLVDRMAAAAEGRGLVEGGAPASGRPQGGGGREPGLVGGRSAGRGDRLPAAQAAHPAVAAGQGRRSLAEALPGARRQDGPCGACQVCPCRR